jgi:hypothetical protein
MEFYLNDEIRNHAICIQPDLIGCAVAAFKKNMIPIDPVRLIFMEVRRRNSDAPSVITAVAAADSTCLVPVLCSCP